MGGQATNVVGECSLAILTYDLSSSIIFGEPQECAVLPTYDPALTHCGNAVILKAPNHNSLVISEKRNKLFTTPSSSAVGSFKVSSVEGFTSCHPPEDAI